jgi:hypothetical protein
VSDTDSFIEEVTEEVRRDALFAQFRKYGWIAVVAVIVIVGGASWNELRKSQQDSAAQATGDALLFALGTPEATEQAAALEAAELPSEQAEIVRQLLLSAAQLDAGDVDAASATLNAAATADVDAVYQDLAAFKAVLAQNTSMSAEDRRIAYEALSAPGRPLALYASEQIALLEIEAGNTEAAISLLQNIALDAGASAGLRQRATQLIVALGGEPEDLPTGTEGQ